MDLRQLRYFIAVAEEKSISAAARRLFLSQPPLSTQLRLLEEELGCVLFERGARRIQLTQAGRMLYERATALLQLEERTRRELHDYTDGTHGTLCFGAVSSVIGTSLTEWIAAFHAQYPAVQFELLEGNTYELLEQLRIHRIELAIVRTPFSADGLEQITLPPEPMLAVGHGSYFSDVPGSLVSLPQLAHKPLIVYRRWVPILRSRFDAVGLQPPYFCINDDARTTALWADAGLGIGLIPQSSQGLLHHPQTAFRQIEDAQLNTGISIVRSKEMYLSTIAARFMAQTCQSVHPSEDVRENEKNAADMRHG